MARLEDKEEQDVVDWAEKHGWIAVKVNILGNVGYPDRIFIGPHGRTVWIEMKKRGQKPRKMQYYRMYTLAEREHTVGWFDNAEEAINFLVAASLPGEGDQDDVVTSMRRSISRSWLGKD